EAAQAGVNQAEAGVAQAEAGLAQAKSALAIISLQIEKASVKAPVDGVVLTKDLQVGEIVAPGGLVMSIGQLDDVDLTVYVAEADYGEIKLDQTVSVRVDSFPGQSFKGKVSAIANEAEFTPRNVQTVDGRKTTVYAVKIGVSNPDRALKPGMPADVTFED
ncbi:MAG TPA: efflux RND transporter periplasmic adaptor subunit, partial [Anaerolineaceae bacterium]|nr:efflux RND transporter periplasmic adaptor subunit [Anaerolineaceae bacterium]